MPLTRDPYAMDVDRLSVQEQANHIKKGLCFVCHLPGHRANNHVPGESGPPPTPRRQYMPLQTPSILTSYSTALKKADGAYAYIKTIYGNLSEKEKRKLTDSLEELGFKETACLDISNLFMIIPIFPVLVADTNKKSFSIPLLVSGEGRNANRRFEMNALIDSGAGGTFINKKFAQQNGIALILIEKLIQAFSMDRTKNNTGTIEHYAWLRIQMKKKKISTRFLATGLGKEKNDFGASMAQAVQPKDRLEHWNRQY